MGSRGARRPAADVANRGGSAEREGRSVAIFVRIPLDNNTESAHDKYVLETLLSTAGVPYRFVPSGEAAIPGQRYVELRTVQDPRLSGQGPSQSAVLSPQSTLGSLFAALARTEEYAIADRDKYGRFLWSHSSIRPQEDAARPLVSAYSSQLLENLKAAASKSGLPFIRVEPWPDGRPMAACITHDVDVLSRGKLPRGIAVRDVRAAVGRVVRGRVGEAAGRIGAIARTASGGDPYWTFDRIAAIEKEHGYRSTYFVMAGRIHPEDASYDPAQARVRGLMRSLVDSGCEIGLHGSFGPFSDPGAVKSQKSRLESALGAPVTGHRNHVLRFAVPNSWRAQQQAGFSYDTTLGYADHEGYRGSNAFPFHPYDLPGERRFDLLELPLALMDVTIHKYRGLRGKAARSAVETVLDETLAVGGLATLLWHNDTFFDPDYPGCGRLFEATLEWLDDHGAWVATCAEVDRWWRAREAVRIEPLPDNSGWEIQAGADIEALALRITPPDGSPERLERLDRLAAGTSIRLPL